MGMMGITDTRNDRDNGDGDGYVGRKSTVLVWLLNPNWTTLEKHHNSLRQPLGMVMHNINNSLILFTIHICIFVLVEVCGKEAPHCPFDDDDHWVGVGALVFSIYNYYIDMIEIHPLLWLSLMGPMNDQHRIENYMELQYASICCFPHIVLTQDHIILTFLKQSKLKVIEQKKHWDIINVTFAQFVGNIVMNKLILNHNINVTQKTRLNGAANSTQISGMRMSNWEHQNVNIVMNTVNRSGLA